MTAEIVAFSQPAPETATQVPPQQTGNPLGITINGEIVGPGPYVVGRALVYGGAGQARHDGFAGFAGPWGFVDPVVAGLEQRLFQIEAEIAALKLRLERVEFFGEPEA